MQVIEIFYLIHYTSPYLIYCKEHTGSMRVGPCIGKGSIRQASLVRVLCRVWENERTVVGGRGKEGSLPFPLLLPFRRPNWRLGWRLCSTLAAWIPFCRGGPLTISTAPRGASRITEMDGRMGKLVSGWEKSKYNTRLKACAILSSGSLWPKG